MSTGKRELLNRINTICLGVRDIVRMRTFYRGGLGLPTTNNEDNPAVVFFKNGGSRLELYPIDLVAKDINEENPPAVPAPGGFCGVTLAYNAKSEAEVDAIFARIESVGGRIAKTPRRVFWGGISGYFQDPEGYCWEVAFYEQWRFDDNGMIIQY